MFVSVNIFGQLGFLGKTNDLLWVLITLTLNIIALFALIVARTTALLSYRFAETRKAPYWRAHEGGPTSLDVGSR